jgi:hypothetical protein
MIPVFTLYFSHLMMCFRPVWGRTWPCTCRPQTQLSFCTRSLVSKWRSLSKISMTNTSQLTQRTASMPFFWGWVDKSSGWCIKFRVIGGVNMAPLPSGVTSFRRFKCLLFSLLQHPYFCQELMRLPMCERQVWSTHIHRHQTEHIGMFYNTCYILATVYRSHGCSSIESIVPSLKFQLLYNVILTRKAIMSLVTDGLVVFD